MSASVALAVQVMVVPGLWGLVTSGVREFRMGVWFSLQVQPEPLSVSFTGVVYFGHILRHDWGSYVLSRGRSHSLRGDCDRRCNVFCRSRDVLYWCHFRHCNVFCRSRDIFYRCHFRHRNVFCRSRDILYRCHFRHCNVFCRSRDVLYRCTSGTVMFSAGAVTFSSGSSLQPALFQELVHLW